MLVDPALEAQGWKKNISLISDVPINVPQGNYIVDYQRVAIVNGCSSRHQLSMEFCFDNRQAIMANLAKAELASNAFEAISEANVGFTYLVLPRDAEARRRGGWDGSAGTLVEYEYAVDTGYRSFLSSAICLVGLS